MLKKAILPLLLACTSFASAATYQLTYVGTINSTYDYDAGTTEISTAYGNIAEGSTITIQLTYDLSHMSQASTVSWPGGSGVTYDSPVATTATIAISSGYSYSGPVTGTNVEVMSFYNQSTGNDQVNFNDLSGNIFMQFNDGSSSAFTTFPIYNDSLEQINAEFMTAVNNGSLQLANGGPIYYAFPGVGVFRDVRINFGTPSVINIAAVPEPSSLLLLSTGLLPLLRRRRSRS